MSNDYMHITAGMQRRLDLFLFALLAGVVCLFLAHGCQAVTTAWDWQALLRAFFRYEAGQGIVPGPLGRGLVTTLRLALWTLIFSLLIGFTLGLVRVLAGRSLRMLGAAFVALTRNLPPMVLVFIVHYFLSGILSTAVDWQWLTRLPGADLVLPEAPGMPVFVSAIVTLSLYEGAYIGEIVRAGIGGIAREQWDAAASLGFSRAASLRLIILPQSFRFMFPPLAGQMASLIKDSAVVSVISVQELTFQGTEFMTSSGLAGEVWLAVTVCYLCLCLSVSFAGRLLEKRRKWA